MPSPFAPYANASISFQVAAAGITIDQNGNPVPNQQTIVITAKLSRDGTATPVSYPGIDENKIALVGHLVSPQTLPDSIKPGMVGELALTESEGRVAIGRFKLLDSLQSPFLQKLAGQAGIYKIRGLFTAV